MKKNTRLILLAVLTLLMVGLLALAASAANIEVTVDGDDTPAEYETLLDLADEIGMEIIDPTTITKIQFNASATVDTAIDLSAITQPVVIENAKDAVLTLSATLTLPAQTTWNNVNLVLASASKQSLIVGKKLDMNGGTILTSATTGTAARPIYFGDADTEFTATGLAVTVNKPSIEAFYLQLFKSAVFTDCTFECWGTVMLVNDNAASTGVITLNNCTVNTGNGRKDYTWYYSGNGGKNTQVVVDGGTYYGKMHSGGSKMIIESGNFESNEAHIFDLTDGDITGMLLIKDGNFKLTANGSLIKVQNAPKTQGSVWADADPDKAAVRILDGTFEMTGNGSIIYDYLCGGENYSGDTKQVLYNNPNAVYNVVVEGGTFKTNNTGSDCVIFRLGNCTLGTKVIIRGGTFENKGGWRGLFNAAGADIEISNGNFTSNGRIFGMHDSDGAADGAYSLTITGGSFTSTGDYMLFLGGKYASTVEINISGGTFSSTGVGVMQFANASFGANCVITGGTFTYNTGKTWDNGGTVRGIFGAAGASITIGTSAEQPAPTFISDTCIFSMADNDVLSPVVISGGNFQVTGNGSIMKLSQPISRTTNMENDGEKKGRVTISGGTFSSENAAAIEYLSAYSCAQLTVTDGDFSACKIPLKKCTEGLLTGVELLTANAKATNTFHMSLLTASGTVILTGTTWYNDVEALWNDLDNSNEDGEITLLVDWTSPIDLSGHNFFTVVHPNGHTVDPEQITGATLGGSDDNLTMDCSKTVFKSATVVLKDNIVVKFLVRLAHGQTKLTVTLCGKTVELDIADAVQTMVNSWRRSSADAENDFAEGQYAQEAVVGEYTFTFEGLVPQCYDTDMTLSVGEATETFNLSYYCEAVKAADESYTALVDALLAYGEAARKYVEGEEVTAPEGFVAPTPDAVAKTEITGVTFKSARLNLADKVSLVFRVVLAGDLADYTVTVGGNAVTPVAVDGMAETYDITVDVAASQLASQLTLSVVKSEETATLAYGVANYIVNMQSNTDVANFLQTIWLYGVAAAAKA